MVMAGLAVNQIANGSMDYYCRVSLSVTGWAVFLVLYMQSMNKYAS
jgi:hypothetical protein